MARVLYIGDPHARPDCLDEMQRLVDHICAVAAKEQVNAIVFLGDQFHTHSVIHLAVMGFWKRAFEQMGKLAYGDPRDFLHVVVGNHDMSGKHGDTNHALMLYSDVVTVIDKPFRANWGVILPYYADHAEFLAACEANKDLELLICHQTFSGAAYENGFYAKDGIDPNLVPQQSIISGHIHTPQRIGKVWYPGSPRWQTVSDANTERAIWVVDHERNTTTSFSTAGVCKPIYLLVDRDDEPAVLPDGDADVIVDIFGPEIYVKARAKELEAKGCRVRPFPTTTRKIKVKESDGLPVSFRKFMTDHKPKNGTSTERLLELAEKRISWLRAEA